VRHLPPLNYLKTFECVARWLNLTRAANELNVTPGAVSKTILNLEAHLNLALFERTNKRLSLTPAGHAYLNNVVKALDVLSQATEEVMLHRGQGAVLRIGALPTFSLTWLIPRLPQFKAQHPNLSIDLKTVPSDFTFGIEQLDLEEMDLDVVFYFGDPNYPGFLHTPITQERLLPVASPNLKHQLTVLADSKPSSELPLLQHSTRPFVWSRWFKKYHGHEYEPAWIARFKHYYMLIEAAISGLGIALLPQFLVYDKLQNGELIALDHKTLSMDEYYFMMVHQSRNQELKIQRFSEWVLSELNAQITD